jgi:phage tail protein X
MPTQLTYTTVGGDFFDYIAFKVYGHEKYSIVIMEANPAYADVVRFDAGVVLNTPFVTQSSSNVSGVPWGTLLQST